VAFTCEMTNLTGIDTRPKPNEYGYEFLPVDIGTGTNFYPQPLYWWTDNCSTRNLTRYHPYCWEGPSLIRLCQASPAQAITSAQQVDGGRDCHCRLMSADFQYWACRYSVALIGLVGWSSIMTTWVVSMRTFARDVQRYDTAHNCFHWKARFMKKRD
jgi:hypothetical protein